MKIYGYVVCIWVWWLVGKGKGTEETEGVRESWTSENEGEFLFFIFHLFFELLINLFLKYVMLAGSADCSFLDIRGVDLF